MPENIFLRPKEKQSLCGFVRLQRDCFLFEEKPPQLCSTGARRIRHIFIVFKMFMVMTILFIFGLLCADMMESENSKERPKKYEKVV